MPESAERNQTQADAEMLKIIDPYSCRQRLTMPRFILNAASDQLPKAFIGR
jgi:PhoPQ-activated pathogenicity-related protein